jgi:hypothetical protein
MGLKCSFIHGCGKKMVTTCLQTKKYLSACHSNICWIIRSFLFCNFAYLICRSFEEHTRLSANGKYRYVGLFCYFFPSLCRYWNLTEWTVLTILTMNLLSNVKIRMCCIILYKIFFSLVCILTMPGQICLFLNQWLILM